jgi:hypothetical protein
MGRRETPWYGWMAFGATVLAVLYSVALLAELLAENHFGGAASDLDIVLIFGQPLVVSLIAGILLHHHCKTGNRLTGKIAEFGVVLYLVYSVLGGFTIAAGGFTAAVLLLAAVLLTPRRVCSLA